MKTLILSSLLVLAAAGSINPCDAATPPVAAAPAVAPVVAYEHREFEATLHAPWRGDGSAGRAARDANARTFTLSFDYPRLAHAGSVDWRLELVDPNGRVTRRWHGRRRLTGRPADVTVRWSGVPGAGVHPAGIWRVRLHAVARTGARGAVESVDQSWQIAVGTPPAPALPDFAPLPVTHPDAMRAAPAAGALPYTVYYGNLHSQTSHSDGGAAVDACKGAQDPQTGAYGPDAAYAYARAHGLDILMASEHNHMYDGSDGTNANADPAAAKALYGAGLAMARDANAAHPEFLALYGMEWGVINNGGHLNIFDSDELLGWEKNGSGALLANTETVRGDYGALYALMRRHGWIGQFNHPAPDGQFAVGGKALAYTEDGDAAMALCEVLNTSAFSTRTDEGETRRSNFEPACNKLLEAGYHLAFASNQDNHCANWGASYGNRTAVLIPNGVPLSRDSFLEALRARRVFATMDKNAQLIFTANGHLMGERFDNGGPLQLRVQWAGAPGRSAASVAIMEGVPGRNGTVTQLSSDAQADVTPAPGPHFYYAKVTQDDGNVLWSAPVWVMQR
jgi:hypothetical protein